MGCQYWICEEMFGTYCHGLLVRCGETSSQLPRNGLYLRWDISSRIFSGILIDVIGEWQVGGNQFEDSYREISSEGRIWTVERRIAGSVRLVLRH